MGNNQSRREIIKNEKIIENLEVRLANLEEAHLQRNIKEMVMEEKSKDHAALLLRKEQDIARLRDENESLLKLLDRARKEKERIVDALAASSENIFEEEAQRLLSEQHVRIFIDDLLKDPNINIGALPDWVERKLYNNVFNMLIALIRKTFNSAAIKFIGHEIKLSLEPSNENQKPPTAIPEEIQT